MSLVTASLESNALPKRASSASKLCGGTLPKDWLSLDESASGPAIILYLGLSLK